MAFLERYNMLTCNIQINACVEFDDLKILLDYIKPYVNYEDVLINLDQDNTTNQMTELCRSFNITPVLVDCTNLMNYSNFCKSRWNRDYCFGIDPDERPNIYLLQRISDLINQMNNDEVDILAIPRINLYPDALTSHDKRYLEISRDVNDKGWNSWPDYQLRLIKNVDYITRGPDIHSSWINYKKLGVLPAEERWAVVHIKTEEHFKRMSKKYESLGWTA